MAEIKEPRREVAVRVENISKKFGRFQAIDQVSFELYKGEVLGFLGPNGAGKTTTMRILTGYFQPSRGKVMVGDLDLHKKPSEVKKRIGYLPEASNFYPDMTVEEFLRFAARLKNVPRKKLQEHIEEKIQRCGLWEVRKRVIGHLSKGYRQRVGIAQALIADPEVIILDEPTNGLDPKQIIEIRELIRELGQERTLILSTHILPEVSMVCTRVLIMNKGKIVATGTSEELEAGLKNALEIYVLVEGEQHKQKAVELLTALPGVEQTKIVEEKKGQFGISIMVSKGQDLRAKITKLFVEQQIPLLEIRSGRLSLEDIFMKILLEQGTEARR